MKKILTVTTVLFILLLSACQPKSPEAATATVSATDIATEDPAESSGRVLAEIANDEGGPVTVAGAIDYTYLYVDAYVSEPVVALVDFPARSPATLKSLCRAVGRF